MGARSATSASPAGAELRSRSLRSAPAGTQSVRRAIALLKAFSERQPQLALQELANALGLTKTTAHRLLAALESEGLIDRDPGRGLYRLGAATIALGQQALRTSDLRAAVRPALEALAQAVGETVTLEVLIDEEMLILDEVAGRHLVAANAEVGTRWPVHATSTGQALLASLPPIEGKCLLAASLRRAGRTTGAELARRWRELERVRRFGFAVAFEELEAGYAAVGAAFSSPVGGRDGAISIGGPTSRLTRSRLRRLGQDVRRTAVGLSERA